MICDFACLACNASYFMIMVLRRSVDSVKSADLFVNMASQIVYNM